MVVGFSLSLSLLSQCNDIDFYVRVTVHHSVYLVYLILSRALCCVWVYNTHCSTSQYRLGVT